LVYACTVTRDNPIVSAKSSSIVPSAWKDVRNHISASWRDKASYNCGGRTAGGSIWPAKHWQRYCLESLPIHSHHRALASRPSWLILAEPFFSRNSTLVKLV
jgi:hypothetical protein